MSTDKNQKIDVLFKEWSMLRDEMKLFMDFHRRDTRLLLISIGLLFTFSKYVVINNEEISKLILGFIPSIIFIYTMFQVINIHMVSVEAKACARIEDKINMLIGDNLLCWETHIAPVYVRGFRNSPIPLSTIFLMVFILTIFVITSYYISLINNYTEYINILHIIEFIIMVISLIQLLFIENKMNRNPVIFSDLCDSSLSSSP